MSIAITEQALRSVARTTYNWVDRLEHAIAHRGEYAGSFDVLDQQLANVSNEAVAISWGTSDDVGRSIPKLITAINDVAISAGSVDAHTGALKAREPQHALESAIRAHGAVQEVLMQHGWHPNGHQFYWPR